mmetsp:Transcript_10559/g.21995  ORF Transcript_10559/g.21995 Transcript_10559/m.21995 type:complete len:242 (+) Transcript_10559:855-1580(+)
MAAEETMEPSANFRISSSLPRPESSFCFQITRNVSPVFLFGAPWNSLQTPCTISAIWLENIITFACSTSVAVLKSRTRITPTMHSHLRPGTMALTPAESEPLMFLPMMSAPASPKPSASRLPNLMMVFSRITVSNTSLRFPPLQHREISIQIRFQGFRFCLCSLSFAISSALNSSSAIFMAKSGLSRMASILLIIFSTGRSTRRFASLVNIREAVMSRIITKNVLLRPNAAVLRLKGRRSK